MVLVHSARVRSTLHRLLRRMDGQRGRPTIIVRVRRGAIVRVRVTQRRPGQDLRREPAGDGVVRAVVAVAADEHREEEPQQRWPHELPDVGEEPRVVRALGHRAALAVGALLELELLEPRHVVDDGADAAPQEAAGADADEEGEEGAGHVGEGLGDEDVGVADALGEEGHEVDEGAVGLDAGVADEAPEVPGAGGEGGGAGGGDEEDEGVLVLEADAVVDPGAVVVHLQDARAALAAVVGARGLGQAALRAGGEERVGVDGLQVGQRVEAGTCIAAYRA